MFFDILVFVGVNVVSFYGILGSMKVLLNELVLFDFGVIWNGYCSDVICIVVY